MATQPAELESWEVRLSDVPGNQCRATRCLKEAMLKDMKGIKGYTEKSQSHIMSTRNKECTKWRESNIFLKGGSNLKGRKNDSKDFPELTRIKGMNFWIERIPPKLAKKIKNK